MKLTYKFPALVALLLLAFSCGKEEGVEAKKAELEKLKTESNEIISGS